MHETLFLGADHAGFVEKERAKKRLSSDGYEIVDVGAVKLNERDDYPVFARRVAHAVADGLGRGILFCGSGEGVAIVANRLPGVRASVCWNTEVAQATRDENDSNVLAVATRLTSPDEIDAIIDVWLKTPFSGITRHKRRIAEIDNG